MRLRDRLAMLDHPELDRQQRIERLRALIGEVAARERPAPADPAGGAPRARREPRPVPVGERRETPLGPLHLIERWLEPDHRHGRVAVRGALEVDAALLALLARDPALQGVDLSRMLILDTETTGLAGGTGTVPFLIGLCFFDEGVLKVEQLFLHNLGAEAPLLQHLAQRVAQASCVVSYNGKAFDWPLLRTRFVLNRVPLPELPPHLDLLWCARRVWKPRLQGVRLCEVEQALLGFYRDDDVPGAEIPALYLGYLRGDDPRRLLPVLAHNQHDLVALAAVLWRLCAHFAAVQPEDDPRDHLAYAKLALRARDFERARAFAEAAACAADGDLALDALAVAAAVARLRGDPQAALAAWQRGLAVARSQGAAARAHLALARLHERKLQDPRAAYRHARFTLPAEGARSHGRRLGRLWRRLERGDRPR